MTNRDLLVRSLLALLLGAVLVTLSYYFVDRQVAYFVRDLDLDRYPWLTATLKGLTYPPIGLEGAAPVVILLIAVRTAWGPPKRLEWTLFAASVNLIVTLTLKNHLKDAFGRAWPATWIGDPAANPSLLGAVDPGTYGFFLYHGGKGWGDSFPSGHTARIVAVVAVLWVAYPRFRWLYVLATALVAVGLVGMNYHFVGDVIGGTVLGGITGVYAAHLAGLGNGIQSHQRLVG
jgi:membrane-associated phospholipid phosphatase